MKKESIIISGYFNPIHSGHIEYITLAKELCDFLIVIVNSDLQRELKGSKEFQNENERLLIISHIKEVDHAIISIDKDKTVAQTIHYLYSKYNKRFNMSFANGGDQNNNSIPEKSICQKLGVKLIDGLGDKIQSSSWLLKSF